MIHFSVLLVLHFLPGLCDRTCSGLGVSDTFAKLEFHVSRLMFLHAFSYEDGELAMGSR